MKGNGREGKYLPSQQLKRMTPEFRSNRLTLPYQRLGRVEAAGLGGVMPFGAAVGATPKWAQQISYCYQRKCLRCFRYRYCRLRSVAIPSR